MKKVTARDLLNEQKKRYWLLGQKERDDSTTEDAKACQAGCVRCARSGRRCGDAAEYGKENGGDKFWTHEGKGSARKFTATVMSYPAETAV